jgi:hypothetical protein
VHPDSEQNQRCSRLSLELLTKILDRLADFATAPAEAFLHVSGGLVGHTLIVKALVVGEITGCLLYFALHLIETSVEFILIHRWSPPESKSYKIRAVLCDLVR